MSRGGSSRGVGRPAGLPKNVCWPLPPPGRVRHAWLLRLSIRRWLLRRLLKLAALHIAKGARIADLGAGTAADLEELRRLRPDLIGRPAMLFEAQAEMLARVPVELRGSAGVSGVRADASRLPLRDGSVDAVLSIGLLCCVAEEAVPRAVAESARVLSPGGILVLAVPRWRGSEDEARTAASGLVRLAGGRPGRAIFRRKPL